jgi:hypothetical protein
MGEARPARATEVAPLAQPWARVGALAVAAGLFLRGLEAAGKSLWLDELHTLDIAWHPTITELNATLSRDVHTPAFYLAVHALRGVLDAHALRWIAIVPSLLALVPLLAIARAAGLSPVARMVVTGLFATLPFQIQWGAELRPYAWLEFTALTATWAAFTPAHSARGRLARGLAFAGSVALGLYTHLAMAFAVVSIVAVRLVLRRPGWPSLARIVAGGVLGGALFLPWVASTHPFLIRDPSGLLRESVAADTIGSGPEAVGETRRAVTDEDRKLLQTPVQTLVPRMGSLRGTSAWLARVGFVGLLVGLAGLVGGALAGRRDCRRPGAELVGAVCVSALAAVVLAVVCAKLKNRLPLQYFTLSAWAWPLVYGALVDGLPARRRNLAACLVVAASATAGLGQALGAPREDLRTAVRLAVEKASARDAWLTAFLWQPQSYARTTLFRVYAPEANAVEPEAIPGVLEEGGERPVVIVTRCSPDTTFWGPLQEGRKRIEATHLGGGVSVYVWAPD